MARRKVIFLDRDGVINRYPGDGNWVTTAAEFSFLPGARAAIARLNRAGYLLYVVSNQAGVEKGLFTAAALQEITDGMLAGIRRAGGKIEQVLYCIHPREAGCSCRKPKTGLLQLATADLELDRENSYFIGDSQVDVETGRNFGVRTILVFSGKERGRNRSCWTQIPDFTAASLARAADLILKG